MMDKHTVEYAKAENHLDEAFARLKSDEMSEQLDHAFTMAVHLFEDAKANIKVTPERVRNERIALESCNRGVETLMHRIGQMGSDSRHFQNKVLSPGLKGNLESVHSCFYTAVEMLGKAMELMEAVQNEMEDAGDE